MFSNFIYFLMALILFTASDLFENSREALPHGVFYALISFGAFFLLCRSLFRRLENRVGFHSHILLDHGLNRIIGQLSILSLVLFAVNIYGYRLRSVFSGLWIFERIPTLEAVVFLGLFMGYLATIWSAAYGIQKRFFPGRLTRRAFVLSNISFSLPALLPWFCLSIFADLIDFLPFKAVTGFLKTPIGEIGYILVFLVSVAVFGPVLIRRLWHCNSLEPGIQRRKIEQTCSRTGLKYADILKWELFGGTMITAGVMGLVGRFRYILVTPALLDSLEDDEVEAVVLHEIGHVQNHHMLFYLFFFLGFVGCNFVFFEPIMLLLYIAKPFYTAFEWVGVDKSVAHPILIMGFLLSSFLLYFRYGFGFLMRNCERQADLHVFRHQRDGGALISTFHKIAALGRQSTERKNWHHFSIGQRIRFLEACQRTPALIQAHHRRVRRIILSFLVTMGLVLFAGYTLQYGGGQAWFSDFITEQVLVQQLAVDPDNSELYVSVGDYYYSRKAYARAVDAYENVLHIDGRNIHALNNLAWLLVTCPDPAFRNPEKGLFLAAKAVAVKREAFVLDTYAEALALNGQVEDAVRIAQEALTLASDKQRYYRNQLVRFGEMAERR